MIYVILGYALCHVALKHAKRAKTCILPFTSTMSFVDFFIASRTITDESPGTIFAFRRFNTLLGCIFTLDGFTSVGSICALHDGITLVTVTLEETDNIDTGSIRSSADVKVKVWRTLIYIWIIQRGLSFQFDAAWLWLQQ